MTTFESIFGSEDRKIVSAHTINIPGMTDSQRHLLCQRKVGGIPVSYAIKKHTANNKIIGQFVHIVGALPEPLQTQSYKLLVPQIMPQKINVANFDQEQSKELEALKRNPYVKMFASYRQRYEAMLCSQSTLPMPANQKLEQINLEQSSFVCKASPTDPILGSLPEQDPKNTDPDRTVHGDKKKVVYLEDIRGFVERIKTFEGSTIKEENTAFIQNCLNLIFNGVIRDISRTLNQISSSSSFSFSNDNEKALLEIEDVITLSEQFISQIERLNISLVDTEQQKDNMPFFKKLISDVVEQIDKLRGRQFMQQFDDFSKLVQIIENKIPEGFELEESMQAFNPCMLEHTLTNLAKVGDSIKNKAIFEQINDVGLKCWDDVQRNLNLKKLEFFKLYLRAVSKEMFTVYLCEAYNENIFLNVNDPTRNVPERFVINQKDLEKKQLHWAAFIAKKHSFQEVFDEEWAKLDTIKDEQAKFVMRRYVLGTFLPILKSIHVSKNSQQQFDADKRFFTVITDNPDPALFMAYVLHMHHSRAIELTKKFICKLSTIEKCRKAKQCSAAEKQYYNSIINCLKRAQSTFEQEQKSMLCKMQRKK